MAAKRSPKKKPASHAIVDFKTADTRMEGGLKSTFQGGYRTVLLFDGDLTLDDDFLKAISKIEKSDFDLVVVRGDLTVDGSIALYESTPGLLVTGTTRAETLEGGDAEIYIGNGKFDWVVYGYYNHGILETGTVETPWVINSNHDLRVTAVDAYWIDNYGDDADCDFGRGNIGESFVKEVLDEDGDGIEVHAFIERLRKKKPVLKPGAKTAGEAALAEVERAKDNRIYELDMSGKKLKAFPKDALAMPWLKKLVLDDNAIGEVPKEIAKLTELEELSLNKCGLARLPDEIGALKKLRVLRISQNASFDFERADPETPIVLPESIGELENLEEIEIDMLSHVPRDVKEPLPETTLFVLPESAAKWKKLRRIIANYTNLVIPKAMHGQPSIEEISMHGGSWTYMRNFPEWVTTLPNLRVLNLNGNFFGSIPASISNLAKLEVLKLGSALGMLKSPLPDLSGLAKLRVLHINGNTGHTGVRKPSHDVLRPLFSMSLPALEELGIDRWGKEKEHRQAMPPELLAGIGKFRALKWIDLEFDGLTSLPDELLSLPAIERLDLRYNALDANERKKIAKAFPRARIDFTKQEGKGPEPSEATKKANELIKAANTRRDRQEWGKALETYDEVIALFRDGTIDDAYMQLYAHYGKMWIHGKTKQDGPGVAEAERCLELVPPVWSIFHFTDEGQFQREVVRYATNFIAWTLQSSPKAAPGDLARALELIERGAACVDGPEHFYVLDTQARVLLRLERLEDAWRIVQRVLHQDPKFAPMQDLKKDKRYKAWAK
jgi:Leucine-rich repeat (LRR) protein